MPVSKHEDTMFTLQSQMRENQSDLTNFLGDLDKWTEEIKERDETLQKQKEVSHKMLPPIRNSEGKPKKKKKKKSVKESKADGSNGKATRISSYDYRSWDQFDVDKACEEVDDGVTLSDIETDSEESDEEWDVIQFQQKAIEEKNKGNDYFNKGDYEQAVEWYSKGFRSDPSNALLPGNRAMALLKLERYGAAEVDATQAITIDPMYFKAYLRRAAARVGLKKFEFAREDYKRLLILDPGNKTAKSELTKLEKELNRSTQDRAPISSIDIKEEGLVKPIYKPPEQRSKKPLKRIEIQEIGIECDESRKSAIAKTKLKQSDQVQKIAAKDDAMFQQFTKTEKVETVKSKSEKSSRLKIKEMSSDQMLYTDSQKNTSENLPKSTKLNLDGISSTEQSVSLGEEKLSPRSVIPDSQPSSNHSSPRNLDLVELAKQKKTPTTSFQFQSDYKEFKNNMEAFYEYFQRIKPSTYPKLFGEALDSDILLNIFTILQKFFIPSKKNCFEHVKYLPSVKRFSMTVMFMSKNDKEGIKDVFTFLQENQLAPTDDLNKLLKVYQL